MKPAGQALETEAVDETTPARLIAAFVAALRRVGLAVPVGAASAFYEAIGILGVTRRDDLYWAGRATLLSEPDQIVAYDRVFAAFWEGETLIIDDRPPVTETVTLLTDDDADAGDADAEGAADDDEQITLRYSRAETLGPKDFVDYDDAELAEAHSLMASMVLIGGRRSSRRRVPTRRAGGRPDLGRTVRAAMRTAGEPIERRFTRPGDRPRRVVFLLDVSGSMEVYARALIRFVQAAVVGRRRVEVFTLGTRLTRVTRELSTLDPDRALRAAGEAVVDWSGGTRLGDSLRAFNDQWAQRGMARGATVVILSDGWDRGEPEMMDEQMARLGRIAHRIVWVNPLKASPGYEPLAAGMAAALPYVDQFIEGHCLDSLETLMALLAEQPTMGAGFFSPLATQVGAT